MIIGDYVERRKGEPAYTNGKSGSAKLRKHAIQHLTLALASDGAAKITNTGSRSMSRSYNLGSPNAILPMETYDDRPAWLLSEIGRLEGAHVRRIVSDICESLLDLARWPSGAQLFWDGCVRNSNRAYHVYSPEQKLVLRSAGVVGDGRPNGPAIAAFNLSGGTRPPRHGSHNLWSIHHIYSGKFIYPGKSSTLHASKEGRHFTQSAGLVALHPLADAAADEFPLVSWLLRSAAYDLFRYDPDAVFFGGSHDENGFAIGGNTPPAIS